MTFQPSPESVGLDKYDCASEVLKDIRAVERLHKIESINGQENSHGGLITVSNFTTSARHCFAQLRHNTVLLLATPRTEPEPPNDFLADTDHR